MKNCYLWVIMMQEIFHYPFKNNVYAYNYENEAADRLTRHSNQIRITRCNSDFASKLSIYNFLHIWNSWARKIDKMTSRQMCKVTSYLMVIYYHDMSFICMCMHVYVYVCVYV